MSKKNRLDYNDPKVNAIASYIHNVTVAGLNATLFIERSVNPIFFTIKNPNKPEQIASGVFVCIKDQYFVFSASHVFDDIGGFQLLMAVEGEQRLIGFSGERFSTARGPSGKHYDDPIDASVFHLGTEVPDSVKGLALSLDDLDKEPYDDPHSFFIISGIRSKNSKTIGNQAFTRRECFGSVELSTEYYTKLSFNKKHHIILAYDDERYVNGLWQKTPSPAGFSGGGIFRVDGLSAHPLFLRPAKLTPLLTAITIEHKKGKSGNPGVLIGTRIAVHLGLIHKYLPGILS
ncbi:TPA: hypothetical protein RUX01_003211 [Aeromonas dhakensis]|nr:hypothetical protein [Aeromonas dhakensis]